jgi:hypothetical protein
VNFINACTKDEHSEDEAHGTKKLDLAAAYIHGACLTFLDSFGSGITSVDRYVHHFIHGQYQTFGTGRWICVTHSVLLKVPNYTIMTAHMQPLFKFRAAPYHTFNSGIKGSSTVLIAIFAR